MPHVLFKITIKDYLHSLHLFLSNQVRELTGEKSDIFLEYIQEAMPAGVQVEIELVSVAIILCFFLVGLQVKDSESSFLQLKYNQYN